MRPNPIILIAAWQGYKTRGDQTACRETYLKRWEDWRIPYKFVYDRDYKEPPAADEIIVDAPTGFMECVFKTHQGIKWAWEQGYDYVFSVPTDCYIHIPRLILESGHENYAYSGYQVPGEGHIGGGSGYWLNRHAMGIIRDATPYLDYEDRWVGTVLRSHGVVPVHDPRYQSWEQDHVPGAITMHLSHATGSYDPKWMLKVDQYGI